MNEKIKNKRPSLGWVMVPLIMLLAGGWFMWGFLAPRAVTTSEGLALISGDTVERVVLNEGTQQVNLTLTENYVHQSTGGDDKTVDLGKDVYFTYSYVQTRTSWTRWPTRLPRRAGTQCVPSLASSAASFSC